MALHFPVTKSRAAAPLRMAALGIALLRGLDEFVCLQRYRLRDWISR